MHVFKLIESADGCNYKTYKPQTTLIGDIATYWHKN